MTELFKVLVIVLLSFSPYYKDKETVEARRERMELIARSVVRGIEMARCEGTFKTKECVPAYEGSNVDMASMLAMMGREESAFALHVHQNKCDIKNGECDGGRARSPWQFQRTTPTRLAWWNYRGADQKSTDDAAEVVVKLFAGSFKGCGNWKGAISSYATGKGCNTWKHAQKRYDYFLRIRTQMRAELKKLKNPPPPPAEKEKPSGPIAKR